MSTFVALNIEPDDDSEEEIDDTKEIQIEEALKLYQNALKLHSQGPQYYGQAAQAYDSLFKSEIFKYRESISEYKRTRLQDPASQDIDTLEESVTETPTPLDVSETTSSVLPQTIYLSYKNRGQFVLDSLKHSIESSLWLQIDGASGSVDLSTASGSAMRCFAEALERDDTDLELWRKGARIGDALRSHRIARFCLESVLDGDDDGLGERFEQLGLEEAFAMEDLRQLLSALCDKLSLSQLPQKQPRKALLRLLKKRIDPFPYLPTGLDNGLATTSKPYPVGTTASRLLVKPIARTWTAVGKEILQVLTDEEENGAKLGPGFTLEIQLPGPDIAETPLPDLPIIQRISRSNRKEAGYDGAHDTEMSGTNADMVPKDSAEVVASPEELHADPVAVNNKGVAPAAENRIRETSEKPTEAPTVPVVLPEDNRLQNTGAQEDDVKAASLRSRKRSSGSVGNDEPMDGGRVKSRRIRARESNAEALTQPDEVPFDQARYFEDRLEIFAHADQWMFGTVGSLLSKLGVEDLGTIDELKQILCSAREQHSPDHSSLDQRGETVLFQDLRGALENWNDEKGQIALHGSVSTASQDGLSSMKTSGLSVFLEHSRQSNRKPRKETALCEDEGLSQFTQYINAEWVPLNEIAFYWLEQHLKLKYSENVGHGTNFKSGNSCNRSSYTARLWPETMKEIVTQIMIKGDDFIFSKMQYCATVLERDMLSYTTDKSSIFNSEHLSSMEITQSLFELHLDIYASMNSPNREVLESERLLQRERLARWSSLARAFINYHIDICEEDDIQTTTALRHLWCSTFHSNMTTDSPREYVLLCLQDLKRVLVSLGSPVIVLLNNAIMPEISIAAIDQEVSRLSSMDFFMNVFGSGSDDPVRLIESLEPILEPSSVEYVHSATAERVKGSNGRDEEPDTVSISHVQEMASFLDRGDATLRLFLWRRLKDAYDAIDYPPKVISCDLRSIEIIMLELQSSTYLEGMNDHRQITLLKWLKSLDDLLGKVLGKVVDESERSFECIDMAHLQSAMSAIARLSRVLHSFALFEDSIRVGQITPAETRTASAKTLEQFKDKLRGMQVRAWVLQYILLKEGIVQNKELFDTPFDDRVHFLRSVHNALGIRSACKFSNKILLKLMKTELLTLQTEDDYENDIAQVLFDLYGLKFSSNLDSPVDHDCPIERLLDRPTALMMVDFVMMQANRMNIKDLLKSELKSTIDKMQMAIGWVKLTSLSLNKRILSAFLKSPIDPSHLFRAVQGIGEISMVPIHIDSAKVAEKGWYFLLGIAALTKFRSQKRINAIPTDDLDLAATFFRRDLEHGTGRWETWYRLAQVYDLKLEEDIAWSADKLNGNRTELVTLQRRAIHSYAMAVAAIIRTADPSSETREMMSDLYTEFGCRMYASSREPLSMDAFRLADFTRHFSSGENQRMYKSQPFGDMKEYSVWNFASYLFSRAMVDKPKHWINHYMFSKCLWKMFTCDDSIRGKSKPVDVDDILGSLVDAIRVLPEKKDSRSEPILEPHFKLTSVVHKLVHRAVLKPEEAELRLLATPWARDIPAPDGADTWKPFILAVLKNLRNADKANWHHRIVARAAHVIYDDVRDSTAAMGAKHEVTQHIFTKTMTLQVWRPENERAGRHFVYTTRYVYFFVQLLNQLSDRTNLDLLIRRVRRKPSDYVNHTKLWEDICVTYIKLFRRVGNVPEGREEAVFKPITHDDFVSYSARLENWCHLPSSDPALIDLLREAVELKKLNNGLTKPAIFEDLIADTYAVLYESNIAKFMEQATEEESRERMKVDHLLMASDAGGGATTPPVSNHGPVPKTRTKGVSRKEIQRKAEAIAAKTLATRPAVKPARPADEESRPQPLVGVAIGPPPIKDDIKEEALGIQSSVPGSVHDSADDESELSEIEEEKISEPVKALAPLFPNLLMKRVLSPKPASELSTNVSVDGADIDSALTASVQETKSEPTEARRSDVE